MAESSFALEQSNESCSSQFGVLAIKKLWSPTVPSIFKKTYLGDAEIKKIRLVFESTLSAREKMQTAYQIYINTRLKEFSPEKRKRILYALDKLVKKTKTGKFEASAAEVSLPEDLRFTATSYATIVHEMEHNINIDALETSDRRTVWLYLFKYFYTPAPKFVDELSAMKAEWEFLHNIPKFDRMAAVGTLSKVGLSKTHERMYRDMLEAADLPLEEYLKFQHDSGRYGFFGVALNTVNTYAMTSPLAVLPPVLAISGYKWACEKCENTGGEFGRFACEIACAEPK